jgi:NitT/TauT family transport system permease protein
LTAVERLPASQTAEATSPAARSRRRRAWLREFAAIALPAVIGVAVALGAWEAWVDLKDIKPYIVPAPTRVFGRLYDEPGVFLREGFHTLEGSLLGFAAGAGIAFLLASLMTQSRLVERAVFPLAIIVKVTPIIAVAPLLTIWFGLGLLPKVFIAALVVFFPVMVNALAGFRSVSPSALDLFESLSATRSEVFFKLRVPSSLPYLFAAFRVALPLSVVGTVVAEWFSGDRGLGRVIYVANSNLNMATAFAGIFSLAVIGVGLYILTTLIESRVLFWHESNREGN